MAEITLAAMQDVARQQAANDTNYLPPRHRTLPILASVTPIANYPSKLRIYLTNASRYWQVRCYLKGKTYTQSLKTTNKQAAISQAKQFFHIKTAELYSDRIEVRDDKKVKFADLLPGVVQGLQARVKRGEFAAANIPKHIYLRLNLPETKKHDKPIVTLQPAVFVYERLLAKQKAEGYGRPDDYLFQPGLLDRRWLLVAYGWQFMYLQSLAGITANAANGQTRTIYSLRHTAMTFRLLYGGKIDLITLARNARTSVEMIERFYSSNLTAEMNIDLLQGKR